MNQTKQHESGAKIAAIISARLNSLELIFLVVFFSALAIKEFTAFETGILFIFSIQALALLYFLNAFSDIEDKHAAGLEIFLHKVVGMALSLALVGILFRIMHWPDINVLVIGAATLLLSLFAIIFLKYKKPELTIFNKRVIVRIVVVLTISVFYIFSTPKIVANEPMNSEIATEQGE